VVCPRVSLITGSDAEVVEEEEEEETGEEVIEEVIEDENKEEEDGRVAGDAVVAGRGSKEVVKEVEFGGRRTSGREEGIEKEIAF